MADLDAVNALLHQTSLLHSEGVPEFFAGHEMLLSEEAFAKHLTEENTAPSAASAICP